MGFPKLAALQNSDDDLVIMRAFHHLNIRFLIEDEVEITRLEEELQRLDEVDAAIKATRYKLKTINQDDSESKAKIKKELRQKLGEYRNYRSLSVQAVNAVANSNRGQCAGIFQGSSPWEM
jgi:hypothetical protein